MQRQDLGSLDANVAVWVLSGMFCPGNLENKSQTFGGGFIIIPVSELAFQEYLVLISKPVSYAFSERMCF